MRAFDAPYLVRYADTRRYMETIQIKQSDLDQISLQEPKNLKNLIDGSEKGTKRERKRERKGTETKSN